MSGVRGFRTAPIFVSKNRMFQVIAIKYIRMKKTTGPD